MDHKKNSSGTGRNNDKEKGVGLSSNPLKYLAGSMGLEPTASGVTGRRYNRLNYDPAQINFKNATQ